MGRSIAAPPVMGRPRPTDLPAWCRHWRWRQLGAAWLLVASAGCTTKRLPPGVAVIDRVDVVGAGDVRVARVRRQIATSRTKHLLGGLLARIPLLTAVDALTVEYHSLDKLVLERDLERVRRYLRARGFYDAMVRAGRVVSTEPGHVRIEISVQPGEPVLIESAQLDFPDWQLAFRANAEMRDALNEFRTAPLTSGEPLPRFDEQRYGELQQALGRSLTDHGFAYAVVTGAVEIDLGRRRAQVRFRVRAGPPCRFGVVRFEGLGEIPQRPVRAVLGIEPGDEYSTAKLAAAERALSELGVFGLAEVAPELSPKGTKLATVVPVAVRVQPIKLRAIKLGVGGEVGSQIDAHAVVGWEDRNFLGGLRRMSIEARPGLVFFPTRFETLLSQVPTDVLPEAALGLSFRQPSFPESRTNTLLSGSARIYLPRSTPVPDPLPQDYNIVGYREIGAAFGFDRNFRLPAIFDSKLRAGQFIKLNFDDPFSYNFDELPDGYQRVLIPYLETLLSWDLRRGADGKPDSINPHRGVWLGTRTQFAGGFLQGDANDIRFEPELRAYAPVSDEITVAVRWATGFLFPRNYGDTLHAAGVVDQIARARDLQLMSFRGLFSGGPSSNRGYGYREVGPHAALPFLSQIGRSAGLLPTGGLGKWELSAELRAPLSEKLTGVLFVDSSDVVSTLSDFRFTHPHISPGLGLRLRTPVGALRLDVGVRVPYLQRLGEPYLEPEQGGPPAGQGDSFPLAVNLAIGEAY